MHEAAAPSFRPVHDPAELERVRRRYGLADRVHPLRRHDRAAEEPAEADRGVRRQRRKAGDLPHQLVCVGPYGWLSRDIEERIERLQVADAIRFTGYVPFEDLPALYSLAEMFVFPSLYEGFGLPVIEAMACGTPVITGRTCRRCRRSPAARSSTSIGSTPTRWARRWSRWRASRERREHLARAGPARGRATFSWERAARETLEVYRPAQRTASAGRAAPRAGLRRTVEPAPGAVRRGDRTRRAESQQPWAMTTDVLFGQAYFLRFDPKLWAAQAAVRAARRAVRGGVPCERAATTSRCSTRCSPQSEAEWADGARSPSPALRGDLRGQLQLPEQDVPAADARGGADDDRRGAARGVPVDRRRIGRQRSSRRSISIAAPRRRGHGRGRGHAGRGARRARPAAQQPAAAATLQGSASARRDGGAIVRTRPREIIRDLDALPLPAWDLVDVERYRGDLARASRLLLDERRDDARLPVPLQLVREADLRPALHRAVARAGRRRDRLAEGDLSARITCGSPTTSSASSRAGSSASPT